MSGYNQRFNFSISIATNADKGLNCSDDYRRMFPIDVESPMYAESFYNDGVCRVYDAAIQALSPSPVPRLPCGVAALARLRKSRLEQLHYRHHEYTSNYTCEWDF
jgi:hypothetical protein